ncbi:APC family permease [Ramlibacter sp.]|uniref:APC family permease n=1 Tax=Ramlibacter sp. TaxID=1917967 RepID=UPI0017A7FCCD|nr:APC family permease [Ramlibacter sp.]MBA2675916.1 APC family permease [Ramlibacter sp.]
MNQLARRISISEGVVLAICSLIGSGLLGLPGLAIEAGGARAAALAWPLIMLISVPLVVVFLTLSLDVQNAGGVATYAGLAVGKWAETAVTFVLALTFMLCIPVGTYMGAAYIQKIPLLQQAMPQSGSLLIAGAILVASTVLNYLGIKPAAWINKASVFALLALIAFIVANNHGVLGRGLQAYRDSASHLDEVSVHQLWAVCAVLFWAFLGWENLSFGSEETTGGARAIRWIFAIAFVSVSAVYAMLALIAAGAHDAGLNISGVTGMLALVGGSVFSPVAYLLIVLIVVANVNSWVFAASRLMYAAGRSRILPAQLGRLSKDSIPRVSLLSMLAVYLVLTAFIHSDWLPLTTGLAIGNQNFIVLYVAAILCYAKRNVTPWGMLVTALAFVSCSFLIVGFGKLLVVPLAMMVMGYAIHRHRTRIATAGAVA